MKGLSLYRHSEKGPDKLLTPRGIELAKQAGQIAGQQGKVVSVCFHGPLSRTGQTAHAYAIGHLASGVTNRVPIFPHSFGHLGSDQLFKKMMTPKWSEVRAENGMDDFLTTLRVHNHRTLERWNIKMMADIESMFDFIDDGKVAAGFFHSPTVQLVIWEIMNVGPEALPRQLTDIPEMGGVHLQMDDDSKITYASFIPAPEIP